MPLDTQAEYLGIAERLAYADPRVRSWGQYLLRDDPPAEGPPEVAFAGFESGLLFSDGTPKPAYDAFQLPLAVRRSGDEVTIWGLVRPSTESERVELWVIDGGRPKRLETLRDGPRRHLRDRVDLATGPPLAAPLAAEGEERGPSGRTRTRCRAEATAAPRGAAWTNST